jgi:hypothetical protein
MFYRGPFTTVSMAQTCAVPNGSDHAMLQAQFHDVRDPACAGLRDRADALQADIDQLEASKIGLDPRDPADRYEITQINAQISQAHAARMLVIQSEAATKCRLPGAFGQQWQPLKNRLSGKAVDVVGMSADNDAPIQQWAYTGGTSQQWAAIMAPGGSYAIVARHSGKALDTAGAMANGTQIVQRDYNGSDSQLWKLVDTGNGYYAIISKASGKSLDVRGYSTANGAVIQQWNYLGGNNQQWSL